MSSRMLGTVSSSAVADSVQASVQASTGGKRALPRRAVAGGLLAAASVALAGCAAGQQAQTAKVYSSIDGVNASVGSLDLRDIGISAPPALSGYTAKSSAPLTMAISNVSNQSDQLVSITTAAASAVKLTAPAAAATTSPSPTPTTAAAGGQSAGVPVPPQGLLQIGPGQGNATATLSGLASPLISGQIVQLTFVFRDAGSKTVSVPVRLAANNTAGETVSVSAPGE